MAAFSGYQDNNTNPFLVDSVYLKFISGFMEDGNSMTMNSNFFYPPLAEPILHETIPGLDHSSEVALSPDDKQPSAAIKHSSQLSTVVDKVESGDQKLSPIDKKRKTKNGSGSSSTSVQSKDAREGKGKKQKQCNGEGKERQKPSGYIHVRARRGQATDSHSLAERARREKISEKMKTLQRLVPGCDKVSGKALMLDEIIGYVQSLQNQVEFLSMKIASVNPMLFDLSLDQQDSFIFNLEERLHGSPLPQCSPNEATAPPTNVIPNTYNTPVDTSAFSQDNANLLWDVEDQVSQSIWIQ